MLQKTMFVNEMALSYSICKYFLTFGCRFKSFSSHDWLQRRMRDLYVEKAKREHYRCGSAFKLLEIEEKYNLLRPGQCVVDIGAAPGSWTQVLVSRTNANGKDDKKPRGTVVAVDKLPIYDIEGAIILSKMDFTDRQCQEKILEMLKGRKPSFVFSDMAPNASGVKALDQENIFNLAMTVLHFALHNSAYRGGCLIKLWESHLCKSVHNDMSRFYDHVHYVKPNATQSESSEIYLLAQGFRGLKRTDKTVISIAE